MRRTSEVEDLLRLHAPQVLGALVRRYGHFDTAEDAVQEALLAAAGQWPGSGIPDNPRGWLIKVASRRLTDALRSDQARRLREEKAAALTPRDAFTAPPPGLPRSAPPLGPPPGPPPPGLPQPGARPPVHPRPAPIVRPPRTTR